MTNTPRTRAEAIAVIYANAAQLLKDARENVALYDWCVQTFGKAPPVEGVDEMRRIAAMRDVEELLADPVVGVAGRLGALSH